MDFSNRSKGEEHFSCSLFEQIAFSVDASVAKTQLKVLGLNSSVFLDRWEPAQSAAPLNESYNYE